MAGFRLADAHSAVARKSGFAAWPQLARHVEQLRALEGTWTFAQLEINAETIPAAGLAASRVLIDGDRFRTESPEAIYEGIFHIDVEAQPHAIDIEFVSGPEAGNVNRGIFRINGDELQFCIDMHGKDRPTQFKTAPGSGHAFETLKRESKARPTDVTGGTPPSTHPAAPARGNPDDFKYVPSDLLSRLQGEWSASTIVRDGKKLPWPMLKMAKRSAKGNEVKITVMGQTMVHAMVRLDESKVPVAVDYLSLCEASQGVVHLGIFEWRGDEACFCMAAPGQQRPTTFEPGAGITLSAWKKR